jgi:hypothetical protein
MVRLCWLRQCGTEDLKGLYADDSRGGHIAHGKLIPLNEIPAFIGTPAEIESSLSILDNEGLRFVYTGETFPVRKDMEFIPFYALHNQRYLIYFPQAERGQMMPRNKQVPYTKTNMTK